jgi:Dihydrodipicolinate synthetase family
MRLEDFRTLHGVIAFPVTPFQSDFSLDIPGLRRNIQELLRHPLAAIVAAGGTGEMYSLTPSEHSEVSNSRATESPRLEHYYSMTLSRCYQGSGGKLGCQTCHDPHVQPSPLDAPEYFRGKCLQCHTEKSCTLDLQKRMAQQPADACSTCHMQRQPALTVSHSTLTDHRILRAPGEPYPESAFKASPDTGFIHVNAVPGKDSTIPPVSLLRAYRQELIRSHLEYKDYYFSLLDQLSQSDNKDPFVLSAIAQKALSDHDLNKAKAYAQQVIDQGSTSTYDYLFLDDLLARSGDLKASIDLLKKGMAMAPYNNLFYENLAVRQLAAGETAESMATIQRGLELFPEDSILREMQAQAASGEPCPR